MPARRPLKHRDTVASTMRGVNYWLLSPFNDKTPKGEAKGYLTAIMYLAPATEAGGKTVCPHSTAACRAGCLYTAGRGMFDKVKNARIRRTRMYLEDRDRFFDELIGELVQMQAAADDAGLKLAIRLNGTSDIGFERELLDGRSIFEMFPRAQFYDYCRWPPEHRHVPPNWHLTFSLADDPIGHAIEHLKAGRNVAAVVPQDMKARAGGMFRIGDTRVHVVDGDEHDLRFLDPSPALVLLKPKGALRRGGPMVRRLLWLEFLRAEGGRSDGKEV